MESQSPISFRLILLCFISSVIILSVIFLFSFFDHRTRVVFCNVGEGSSIYIRVQNKIDVLINAGPDKKILSCLSRNMPFFDRTIEYVFLTTPSANHVSGIKTVFKRFSVRKMYIPIYFQGNKSTNEIISYLKVHKIDTFLLENVKDISILDSEIKILTFKSKSKASFPILFTKGHYKLLLFNAITGRDVVNFIKTPTVYNLHNLYLIQLPFMGLSSDPFSKFISLAERSYIVINKQSFNINSELLKKIKAQLKAVNTTFVLLNNKEDEVFNLN